MTLQTSTLRPGLIVSLKTSVTGNVKYDKTDIDPEHRTDDGGEEATWQTTRTIADKDEHEASQKARHKASSLVRSICSQSAFGLLCPEAKADKLEAAVAEAHKVVAEFNKTATLTRLNFYVLTGRVASDDVEAMKAINSEVTDLLRRMESGVRNMDVKVIRDAATRARGLGQMLSQDAEERIAKAVEAVRKTAKDIVKAGETAAKEVDLNTLRTLSQARTAFLDLDGEKEVGDIAASGRAIDMTPQVEVEHSEKVRALEVE
jgi:hypothetical protein